MVTNAISPTFNISSSGNYGIATAKDFPPEASSHNDPNSMVDVFFEHAVDRIEIEYLEGNVDGDNPVQRAIWLSDMFFCPNEGVLPVTFLDFRVEATADKIDVLWSTSEELNNSYFSVQRSLSAGVWETVAQVPGAGTTDRTQAYRYTEFKTLQRNLLLSHQAT